jgi:hypothetical protein
MMGIINLHRVSRDWREWRRIVLKAKVGSGLKKA